MQMAAAAAAATAAASTSIEHKVFFIGPNKTGTRSWCDLLKSLGLRTLHDGASWSAASRRADLAFFERHDAYCDGDAFDVAWLASAFPRATFVYNTRALLPWLVSRVFHAQDATHSFLAGNVKSLALHNDDATVACWVIQRDTRLQRARELLPPERLAVLDITTATSSAQLLAQLRPLLPPQVANRVASAAGSGTSLPHRGERSSERSAQQVQLAEARVRAVLRRMHADPTATEMSGATWTQPMADGCPRLTGMGGVSLGVRARANATKTTKRGAANDMKVGRGLNTVVPTA